MKRAYSDNAEERKRYKETGQFGTHQATASSRRDADPPITQPGSSAGVSRPLAAALRATTGGPKVEANAPLGSQGFERELPMSGDPSNAQRTAKRVSRWDQAPADAAAAVAARAAAALENESTLRRAILNAQLGYAGHSAAAAAAADPATAAVAADDPLAAPTDVVDAVAPAVEEPAAAAAAPVDPVGDFNAAQLAAPEPAAAAAAPMDRVGDLNPAQLAALPKDWYQPTREAFNDLNSAPGWCAHNLKELKIEIISSSKRFVAASSAQHCDCTYQMPPGMKTVELRENVFCGDAHTEHDEATQARVGAELVAVEGEGGEQRLQLQLYGSMPGMLANPKRAFDVNALRTLQQLVNVKLASLLLWLFRGEGILTAANAWGMLRHVRPITGDTAAAASQDESSCYGCSI